MFQLSNLNVISKVIATTALLLSFNSVPNAVAGDLENIDVAGIKLGMTQDEAIAALKKYDPTFTITDVKQLPDEKNRPERTVGSQIYDSHYAIVAQSRDYLEEVKLNTEVDNFLKNNRKCYPHCPNTMEFYASRAINTLDTPKLVTVWLSPVPGQEKVIAVSSSTVFYKNMPTVENTLNAIGQKYNLTPSKHSEPAPPGVTDLDKTLWWVFDKSNNLQSEKQARHKALSDIISNEAAIENLKVRVLGIFPKYGPSPFLPRQVDDDLSKVLVAKVSGGGCFHDAKGNEIYNTDGTCSSLVANTVSIVLFDSKGLVMYGDQAKEYAIKMRDQMNKTGSEKASKAVPKI